MGDWLDRTVQAARSDPELVRGLERVRDLERRLLGGTQLPGGMVVLTGEVSEHLATSEGRSENDEYERILDRMAEELAAPDENAAELAQWLSYHYEDVLERV